MPALESFPPGTVVGGDFRVLFAIGQGGMGVVFAAEQLSTGKRRALKLMLGTRTSDPELRRRFEQEARVGALISSEHVVDVIAAGVEPSTGLPWLAMELLEGEDLGACLRRSGSLLPSETREILAQLCHALAAAHAIPLVHRDLKPENVFLARARREGAGTMVKVLDFGIAKVLSKDASSSTGAVGTPLWMAPEQASVDHAVSPAADVWALGLLAFLMLTGDVYWRGTSSPMELMKELLFDPLESATRRAGRRGAEGRVPPGFDAWFERCVAREPEARFATAGEAWSALSPILASAPEPPPFARRGAPVSPDAATLEAIGPVRVPGASAPPLRASTTASATVGRTVVSALPPPRAGRTAALGAILGGAALLVALAVGALELVRLRGRGADPPPVDSAHVASHPRDAQTGEMKLIPGGTFQMGSNDSPPESPRHTASVAPFYLDVTEVTVRAYRGCVLADKCPSPTNGVHSNFEDRRDDHPMNWIDWNAARSFCEWADKRLPSEAEWEFAAQGALWRHYPWGNDPPGDGICWKRASLGTCAVGTSPRDRSPFGMLDMGGNVMEWTSSRFCPYTEPDCHYEEQPTRVARGGSWSSDSAPLLENQFRYHTLEVGYGPWIGVRCARDAH